MKLDIAVISDIHGNYIALIKVLSIAIKKNISTFIFLGDYVGELAYPQKTMDIIFKMKEKCNCYFIRGNKEDYWLNYHKNGEIGWKENSSTTGCLFYAYKNLRKNDLEFFEELSYVKHVNFDGFPQLTICHGSPDKVNKSIINDDEDTLKMIKKDESDYILCGHTHIQSKIEYENKVVLNPGSAGFSLMDNGKAQFMILHGIEDKWREEFISIDYNKDTVIRELHESGLYDKAPYWCKITECLILNGNVDHNKFLVRAMDLCKKDLGSCIWPNIPEKYWKQAVKDML